MAEENIDIKKFTFRGKTLDELKAMPHSEFMKLVKSRMRRAMKRGFSDVEKKLIVKAKAAKEGAFIKTHAREMIVLPEFVGKRFGVYSGKEWKSIDIKEEKIDWPQARRIFPYKALWQALRARNWRNKGKQECGSKVEVMFHVQHKLSNRDKRGKNIARRLFKPKALMERFG